jgi:hypothetical protein
MRREREKIPFLLFTLLYIDDTKDTKAHTHTKHGLFVWND